MSFLDQISADLDVFFSDFSVNAVLSPSGGYPRSIKVIFDNAYENIELFSGIGTTGPIAQAKDADVMDIARNDLLTVNGRSYYIGKIKPDGTGITIMGLSEDQWV